MKLSRNIITIMVASHLSAMLKQADASLLFETDQDVPSAYNILSKNFIDKMMKNPKSAEAMTMQDIEYALE